jgi:hypothetical protein
MEVERFPVFVAIDTNGTIFFLKVWRVTAGMNLRPTMEWNNNAKLKLDLSNLEQALPAHFSEEQIARAKTLFYKRLAEQTHHFIAARSRPHPRLVYSVTTVQRLVHSRCLADFDHHPG